MFTLNLDLITTRFIGEGKNYLWEKVKSFEDEESPNPQIGQCGILWPTPFRGAQQFVFFFKLSVH